MQKKKHLIYGETTLQVSAKTFFFFGEHLILAGEKPWIFDFGQKKPLNFGEDLFFGNHLIFTEKSSQSNSSLMKFWVKFVYGWNKLQKKPLLLQNPGYAPDLHQGSVNAAKASPHAKFYNLSWPTQRWALAIALAPQLFLNGCSDACAASILAILSAIAQAQVKYDYEWLFFNQM